MSGSVLLYQSIKTVSSEERMMSSMISRRDHRLDLSSMYRPSHRGSGESMSSHRSRSPSLDSRLRTSSSVSRKRSVGEDEKVIVWTKSLSADWIPRLERTSSGHSLSMYSNGSSNDHDNLKSRFPRLVTHSFLPSDSISFLFECVRTTTVNFSVL